MLNANIIDLQWIAERTGGHWISGHVEGIYNILLPNSDFQLLRIDFRNVSLCYITRFHEIINQYVESKSNIIFIGW